MQIRNLEQELVDLDADNSQLQSLIEYLKTDEYAELAAKRKLGMKKEGEKVILVTELDRSEIKAVTEDKSSYSNFKLWWNYFFN